MKKIFFIALAFFSFIPLFSFEWPAKNFDVAKVVSTFAQNRKGFFNQSLVFPQAEEVCAADNGRVLAIICEHQDDGDWFESTLGSALVVFHDDNLISSYGNLDAESLKELEQKEVVSSGEGIAKTGHSGWAESAEESLLEFQISDTNGKTFINPLILMPRAMKAQKILMEGVSLENQFGRIYTLSTLRSVPAGNYSVYKKTQGNIVPYKTTMFVNGTELEVISRDTLKADGGHLVLTGNKSYTSRAVYPNEGMELLGHILLPHGSNTIMISAKGIIENETSANYVISGY